MRFWYNSPNWLRWLQISVIFPSDFLLLHTHTHTCARACAHTHILRQRDGVWQEQNYNEIAWGVSWGIETFKFHVVVPQIPNQIWKSRNGRHVGKKILSKRRKVDNRMGIKAKTIQDTSNTDGRMENYDLEVVGDKIWKVLNTQLHLSSMVFYIYLFSKCVHVC